MNDDARLLRVRSELRVPPYVPRPASFPAAPSGDADATLPEPTDGSRSHGHPDDEDHSAPTDRPEPDQTQGEPTVPLAILRSSLSIRRRAAVVAGSAVAAVVAVGIALVWSDQSPQPSGTQPVTTTTGASPTSVVVTDPAETRATAQSRATSASTAIHEGERGRTRQPPPARTFNSTNSPESTAVSRPTFPGLPFSTGPFLPTWPH